MGKPVWAVSMALRQAGVACSEQLARLLAASVPAASPDGALYLYGTAAEDGSIGVREGDTVTYYNGAVLPNVCERYTEAVKAEYPYLVLADVIGAWDTYRMFACSDVSKHHFQISQLVNGTQRPDFYWGEGCRYIASECDGADGTWGEFGKEIVCTEHYNFSYPMWASFDVKYEDGTVYQTAAAPIPVSGPVGYSHNGTVLPELPEWDQEVYPYAVINSTTAYGYTRATLCYYRNVFVAHDENYGSDNWSLLVNGEDYLESTISFKTADGCSDKAWSEPTAKSLGNVIGYVDVDGVSTPYTRRLCNYNSDYVKWSNHSFNGANGEEWITATDPIPVYE